MHHRWKLLLNNGQSFGFHALSPHKNCKYSDCPFSALVPTDLCCPMLKRYILLENMSQNYQILNLNHVVIKQRSIHFWHPALNNFLRKQTDGIVCMCIKWPKAHVPGYSWIFQFPFCKFQSPQHQHQFKCESPTNVYGLLLILNEE